MEKKERLCGTAEPSHEFNFDRFCQLLDKAFEEWCEELQKQLEQGIVHNPVDVVVGHKNTSIPRFGSAGNRKKRIARRERREHEKIRE